MYFSNIDYTVCYVDPSKSTNGDGSSIVDAMNNLPQDDSGYAENTLYLIRRTAEAVAVTIPNITVGRKNFVFMGMPKEDDWCYDQVPQIAKDAWGADTAEYANIKSTVANGRFFMQNVQNFHLFRVYVYRNNLDPSQYIFSSEKTDYSTQVSFQKCKFGSLGVDLDKQSYTTQVTAQRGIQFCYFQYIKSWIMQDCVINFSSPTGGTYYGFYTELSQFVSIQDVQVNNVFQNTYYANWPFYFSRSDSGRPCTAYIENITMKIKFNGAYSYVPNLIFFRAPEILKMRNINVEIAGSLGTASPTNLQLYQNIIYISESRQYEVENINVGLPAVWNVESSGCCLNLESFFNGNRTPGNSQSVKNIHITMEEVQGIDTAQGRYYDRAKYTDYSRYAVFRFSSSNYDDSRIPKFGILENINVYNERGVAAYLYGCQIRDARFHGSVKMQYVVGEIEEILSWYPAYAVFAANYTTVRIQRINMNLNNESYPPQEEPVVYNTVGSENFFVYVDFCNARLRPNVASTENRYNFPAAICSNEVENGHFSHRSGNFLVDTWTVARTGGAPASLKLYNNFYNSSYMFYMGQEPFGGSKLTATKTGLHYVVVYAAFKGFSNTEDLGKHVVIQCSVPDGTGYYKRYFSNINGTWTPDTSSVWEGDNGLTQVVLIMPVDVKTTAEQVDLKIHFSWYSAAGFIYIDPAFVLYPADEMPAPEETGV